MAQRLKHLLAMWETQVRSLDQEDPLGKQMANHSSILAWRIPWMEGPWGLKESNMTEQFHLNNNKNLNSSVQRTNCCQRQEVGSRVKMGGGRPKVQTTS